MAAVLELPLSPGACKTLQWGLSVASKVGDVDGFGRSGESFFWRAGTEMARQIGVSIGSLRRYLKELRSAGVLRWRRVEEGQLLPSGARARVTQLVFYVDVHALRARLNAGTNLARCDQFDRTPAITPISASARNPVDRPPPPKVISDLISVVNTEPRSQIEPPPTQTTGGGDGLKILESLVDEWWLRIGAAHLPPNASSGRTVGEIHGAIAKALRAGYSPDDVRDVLDAAADERIGQEPHRWCKERRVWGRGLFGGCFDRLLSAARDARARRPRLLEREGTAKVGISPGMPPTPDPAEQARINASGAQSLLAAIGAPGRSSAGG